MSIVRLILVNILIVNVWLRLSKTIFASSSNYTHARTRKPFLLWILWGALLFFYPKIITSLNLPELIYTLQTVITPLHIAWISLWVWAFLILFFLAFKKRSQPLASLSWILAPLLVLAVLIALISTVHPRLWSASYLLYFMTISFSEESVKFFGASPSRLSSLLPSDIILLSIIAALWFWCIENIIYALAALWDGSTFSSLKPALNSTLTRGAVWFMMHALFTWTIATIVSKHLSSSPKNILLRTVIGSFVWVMFHTFYNTIVYNGWTRLLILIISAWYLLLTYLMVSSNSIYLSELDE